MRSLAKWQGRSASKASGDTVTGRGVAYVKYEMYRTYVGVVATVEVERKTGVIRVRHFAVAHVSFVGPARVFLVAAVDLQGDRHESSVAKTLRELEKRIEQHPLVERAALTVAAPAKQGCVRSRYQEIS